MNGAGRKTGFTMILQKYLQGKSPDPALCEDAIFQSEDFIAVIDGVTAKGSRLYDGKTSGAYAAEILCRALEEMPAEDTAAAVISTLNEVLLSAGGEDASVEELPQANIVIFSRAREEIWLYGDCHFLVNGRLYDRPKEVDVLMASLRSFIAQDLILNGMDPQAASDQSRRQILPFLKMQADFSGKEIPFGYDVLGGPVHPAHILIIPVKSGDHVVLSSDGYPKLFDTLEESEAYLQELLRKDPFCIHENRQTKGTAPGNCSYDDRAYISFYV